MPQNPGQAKKKLRRSHSGQQSVSSSKLVEFVETDRANEESGSSVTKIRLSKDMLSKHSDSHQDSAPNRRRATMIKQICSFVEWPVHGVVALAVDSSGARTAVARTGGRIELRDGRHGWIALSVGPPPPPKQEGIEVSNLAFMGYRYLWASRMDGALELWDIAQDGLRSICVLRLGGGALWDIAVQDNKIAAACDDGCVRIVELDESYSAETALRSIDAVELPRNEFGYVVRTGPRANQRVLCLSWFGDVIACGDAGGAIRWMDARSMKVFGRGVCKGTHIWSLCFAKNGKEVICGNSSGIINVWNSLTCNLIEEISIEGLHGDILSLASSARTASDEIVLIGCAGGTIGGMMASANAQPGDSWISLRAKRFHTHDVRALIHIAPSTAVTTRYSGNVGPMFLSGSLDSSICQLPLASFLKDMAPTRIRPYLGPSVPPHVQFIPRNSAIVCRYCDRLDVWRLYLDSPPALLFRLTLESMEGAIRSCAVSENLGVVAVSGANHARIYRIVQTKGSSKKRRRSFIAEESPNARPFSARIEPLTVDEHAELIGAITNAPDIVILGKPQHLVAINEDREGLIVSTPLANEGFSSHVLLSKKDLHLAKTTDRIVRLFPSPASHCRFALLDSTGSLSIFEVTVTSDKAVDAQLLTSKCVQGKLLTATFAADGEKLAFASSAGEVKVLDLRNESLVNVNFGKGMARVALGLSFSPLAASLVLTTDNCCAVAPLVGCGAQELRKDSYSSKTKPVNEVRAIEVGKHENILGANVMSKNRLVIVQRPWKLVVPSLPPVLPRKLFGT